MNALLDIVITGLGTVTPIGLSAHSTCAALRAGVSRIKEIQTYWPDKDFSDSKPAIGGRVPTEWFEGEPVPEEWPGHERFGVPCPPPRDCLVAPDSKRLIELAIPAIREVLADAGNAAQLAGRIGVYIGFDEYEKTEPVVEAIQDKFGALLSPITVKTEGRAAGLAAVEAAARDLTEANILGAVVGGVDSLIRGPVLEWLDTNDILRSERNPQGVIPGEAAAFVYLESSRNAEARGARPQARLLAARRDEEPTGGTEEPNQAIGLTKVLHKVRKESGDLEAPPLVVCDLNGDRYRAMEWAFASMRTIGNLHGDMNVWHPADCIGDCGAASGLVNVIWAVVAFGKKYANADRALVWGASEGKTRAAVMLAPV